MPQNSILVYKSVTNSILVHEPLVYNDNPLKESLVLANLKVVDRTIFSSKISPKKYDDL